jgi:hypothetical protein
MGHTGVDNLQMSKGLLSYCPKGVKNAGLLFQLS